MPFTNGMTTTAQVDDSIVEEFEAQFLLSYAEMGELDAFASWKRDINAKSIDIPRYDQLSLATTPLTEDEDPDSEALADSKVNLQPEEYGKVVTTTKLANLQAGGKPDLAAAQLVGMNMARTEAKLFLLAADASANVLFPGAVGSEGALTDSDVMDSSTMNRVYNKLSRTSVPGLPSAGGDYVMIAHDDVIHDIRDGAGAGTWQDLHKYSLPGEALKNEVGMYRGFRVVRNNLATLTADGGSGTVDSYTSYFVGFNGIGKAVGQDPRMVISGPFDKLQRFLNVGWLGCMKYGIVQPDAVYLVKSASSVGAN